MRPDAIARDVDANIAATPSGSGIARAIPILTARGITRLVLAATFAVAVAGSPAATGVPVGRELRLERVGTDFDRPLQVIAPASDSRLFVVEQTGRVRIIDRGRVLRRPFLDLHERVSGGNEQGLLSIAFHPHYASNRTFFVSYTDRRGDTRIERLHASTDPNLADPRSATLVLRVEQPYTNHNGGLITFGPDGMLYVGLGDGGSGGDPQRHAQDLGSLLGKLLRIDVDHGSPYAIPRDNPYADRRDARPEIWASGLRNPWRFAFDPPSGQLFIGDVGQNAWEEVDVAPASRGGIDYGWSRLEGSHCYRNPFCNALGTQPPVVEYPHAEGCTVIGGVVYRGRRQPSMVGHYFYAEHCHGWIRSFRWLGGRVTAHTEWRLHRSLQPTSFGTDGQGELYVCSLDGAVYRIGADNP